MNKTSLAISILFLLVVSTSCGSSHLDTENPTFQTQEENSDTSMLTVKMMDDIPVLPPQDYCEVYSVGEELLSASDWMCYNTKNGDGQIATVCNPKNENLPYKHFYDEHYVCAE